MYFRIFIYFVRFSPKKYMKDQELALFHLAFVLFTINVADKSHRLIRIKGSFLGQKLTTFFVFQTTRIFHKSNNNNNKKNIQGYGCFSQISYIYKWIVFFKVILSITSMFFQKVPTFGKLCSHKLMKISLIAYSYCPVLLSSQNKFSRIEVKLFYFASHR